MSARDVSAIRWLALPTLWLVPWLLTGCQGGEASGTTQPVIPTTGIHLVDATQEAGLAWEHQNHASAERYLPETMGAGVAIFDADGDGRNDLFLVGGMAVEALTDPRLEERRGNSALLLGRDDGTFEDRTVGSGLDIPLLGMGTAVGDVDNDGDLDLLVTTVGGQHLFENRGGGIFDDVTVAAGLTPADGGGEDGGGEDGGTIEFGSSAAFLDFDRDGWLDLFVGRYIQWSPATDLPCLPDGVHRSYCTPEAYPRANNRLYRNQGGIRFEDVTVATGAGQPSGKTLGIAVLDFDDDQWPDLLVANDTAPNALLHNLGNGRFEDVALDHGIAVGQSGAPRGAMGVDSGDFDGDLRPDIVIGNFAQEMSAVYRLTQGGVFVDEAASWGVGLPTLMPLGFGVQALDLDLDGWLDLVFVHGHIEPEIARFRPAQQHAQSALVFRNRRGEGFEAVNAGSALDHPLVGRGLASGDLDGDGDLDLVVTQNGGPAQLWRNDSPPQHFLRLRLEGRKSNRNGFGARVDVTVGGRTLRRWLVSGRSYLSSSEPVLTFGLGQHQRVDSIRVTWPSGHIQELGRLEIDQLHVLVEPDGSPPPH